MQRKLMQKGFTLLELTISTVVIAILFSLYVAYKKDELDRSYAANEGRRLAQLSNATLQYIAEGGADGIYNDTNFLKLPACGAGTSAEEYVPCAFTDIGLNGIDYTITVASPNVTITSGPPTIDGTARPDVAAQIVQHAQLLVADTVTGGFFDFTITFPGNGNINTNIDLVAGTGGLTAILDGEYLRRDGGNNATGNIDFGGFNVQNANQVIATGATFTDVLVNNNATVRNRANLDQVWHEAGAGNVITFNDPSSYAQASTFNANSTFNQPTNFNNNATFAGGQYSFNGVNTAEFIANGEVVDSGSAIVKPVCPAGLTPQILAAPSYVTHNEQVETISGIDVYAVDSGTDWNVYVAVNVNGTWEIQGGPPGPASSAAKAIVQTRCGI